jgi:hypothetical protein
MNARRHNLVRILSLGVLTTVLGLTAFFWGRSMCGAVRCNSLYYVAPEVRVNLPPERQSDPNLTPSYFVKARPQPDAPFRAGLGVLQYLQSRLPTAPQSPVYRWEREPQEQYLYFDRTLGQIVKDGRKKVTHADGTTTLFTSTYFAGPDGVAEASDEKLGRFVDPLVDRSELHPLVVFDRGLARFLRIDWTKQTVTKGPELPPDGPHHPVQVGYIRKNPQSLDVMLFGGSRRGEPEPDLVSGPASLSHHTLVLDASGRIDLLDVDTLELVRSEMHLPVPSTLYYQRGPVMPRDLGAYAASLVVTHAQGAGGRVWDIVDCAVASLSRDGTSVRLEVFDPNGRRIGAGEMAVPQSNDARHTPISSSVAAYLDLPGAYGLTLAQFTLETLHPPIFLLLSYFGAPHFEATAAYRSLLLLPDSFIAMKARATANTPIVGFFASMVFLIPALILVALLAWWVNCDGASLGLSKNARTAWIVGTIVFGLPAYITYRLTRPKVTQVTCTNCGRSRRPDMDQCHRCGSPWVVPELTPPGWRVLGAPEPAEENSLSREPRADLQVQ